MASTPNSRETFKQYCLRRCGYPVIQINVNDDQLEDRISDALQFWHDYHYDGTEKQYYKYQITQTDIDNKYITLPENIIGAISIFPIGQGISSNSMFSIRYQMALNDLFDLANVQMAPYYMTMQYYQMVEQILVGLQPIRFNRHVNRLYVDMAWDKVNVGEYLIVECYGVIDPDTYPDVWNDRWLKSYCSALFKRQFGEHLIKFKDQVLPGGTRFNAEKIYNDAVTEIHQLEDNMIFQYGGVLEFFSG